MGKLEVMSAREGCEKMRDLDGFIE